MVTIIRIYYDIKNKQEYESFLFNYLVRSYLENGDWRISKNIKSYHQRFIKLIKNEEEEITIFGRPLMSTAILGASANVVYIQQSALYKTNSEVLGEINNTFKVQQAEIYVFDKEEVIGKWNIN